MLSIADLKKIAKARVRDAEALRDAGRYDAAVYLCGYAVEIALKARICQTLKWPGYPATAKEFEGFSSLRTHDLQVLLHLSGREVRILAKYFGEWSLVAKWNTNIRYRVIGSATAQDVIDLVNATKVLLPAL